MKRPRRPILAACFAALLLAILAVWIASDRVGWLIAAGHGRWAVSVPVMHGRVIVHLSADAAYGGAWSYGCSTFRGPNLDLLAMLNVGSGVPLWFLLPFPAIGLWWFWKGQRADRAGFPVVDPKEKG